jgi:predicted dinucleotide-binding enzyme
MKVGILGSGIVGQTLAAGFVKHGHEVKVGTRDPNSKEIGKFLANAPKVSAGTYADTAKFGDILILAVLGRAVEDVISLAGPHSFASKAVIDTTNPISNAPPTQGVLQFTTGPNESLGEKIQMLLPQAYVVKAFNSVGSAKMVNPQYEQGTPTMFLCGDNESAKAQVAGIIKQFGWEPFDSGGIIAARALEPLCILWCIPGFLQNQWTHAFKLLTH